MTPLSQISAELRSPKLNSRTFETICAQCADAIDAHARESVNQRLLDAAKHWAVCVLVNTEREGRCKDCEKAHAAIAAAESAQPVERKVEYAVEYHQTPTHWSRFAPESIEHARDRATRIQQSGFETRIIVRTITEQPLEGNRND